MFNIRHAEAADKSFWLALDRHLPESEFRLKVRDRRGYVVFDDEKPVGVLRYNLFWDNTPFLTMIYIEEAYRGKGFGKLAMLHWEAELRRLGYKMALLSTQADESAQHFYRKLGYQDTGCLVMNIPPFEQPLEMFMAKAL